MTDHELLQSLRSQIDAQLAGTPPVTPTPPVEPTPPVTPPTLPTEVPPSGIDLSDMAPHVVSFAAGQPQTFQFVATGNMVDLTISTVSGSFAKKVTDSGPGFANRVTDTPFSPFRHKAILQPLSAGRYGYQVALDRSGQFMIQCLV